MKIYMNGTLCDEKDARVSVLDHGLLYGDGVFEGIRAYSGKVFRLKEHISRLRESARALLIDMPLGTEELEKAVLETVKANGKEDCYIRLIVTRGQGPMGLDPSSCKNPTVIIIVCDLQLYPEEYYANGIEIVTSSTRRAPSDVLDPRIKSLNYLNNVMAKIEASLAGCLEAVMLNKEGYVAECTADNIFVIKGGGLLTPPPSQGALDGITMRTVLDIASGAGIKSGFSTLTRYDLYNAEECFLTGTGAEIMPVIKIDGRSIGNGAPGAMTERLKEEYGKLVTSS
jgi:branched-chain amino acid aminotransferase